VEETILSHLIENKDYGQKVLPFLKEEYFSDEYNKRLFNLINDFAIEYKAFPTKEILYIELQNLKDVSEKEIETLTYKVSKIDVDKTTNLEWLIDETENFCQRQAVHNALVKSIEHHQNEAIEFPHASIIKYFQEAARVSFKPVIGHDYVDDSHERFKYYTEKLNRTPFDIDVLNKITKGGLPDKTLSAILAPSGAGKTLILCHFAASNLFDGQNAIYFTMEIDEKEISKRIDANLLNVPMNVIDEMSVFELDKKMEKLKQNIKGKLKVIELSKSMANVNTFKRIIDDLKFKTGFKPDIMYVDYLGLCSSVNAKADSFNNSYGHGKAVAEELRDLAKSDLHIPIVTALQPNRAGLRAEELHSDMVSESKAITDTLDMLLGVTIPSDFEEKRLMLFKILKTRFNDISYYNRFVIRYNRSNMRLQDVDQMEAKEYLELDNDAEAGSPDLDIRDVPVMDNTNFGLEDISRMSPKKKFTKEMFKEFQ
jgi:replicative DNA helicase